MNEGDALRESNAQDDAIRYWRERADERAAALKRHADALRRIRELAAYWGVKTIVQIVDKTLGT